MNAMMHHIHYLDKKSVNYLSEHLTNHYLAHPEYNEIVVVGVGTNRYSGDALGPTVGSLLQKQFGGNRQIRIFGTLERPVHALNLNKTLTYITKKHSKSYVIAVDACLGQFYKIGTLQLVEEPLAAGISLNKELPPVGQIHLKGIVNNHGPLNHKVLEHTSLTFVNEMADVISRILAKSIREIVPNLIPAQMPGDQATNQTS
ncbi:spore protease YyaC [Paenibacillus naphthalenovorans]|uniref:spore protease YyaC n=1 Tax=Paenibacillus naphthalenovorans TaxID=162209 RepID=UPI003D2E0331